MKRLIRGVLFVVFLSLAVVPYARAENVATPEQPDADSRYFPDLGIDDIYWHSQNTPPTSTIFELGGEDVSYDRTLGSLVPLEDAAVPSIISSLLPEAIPAPHDKPMIAIVIDDMGVDLKRSARAVKNLKAPVTMSYLAYARNIREQVASAKEHGHEIILHMPWEPDSETADPGPNHLSVSMSKERILKNVLANLDGFEGYVGVNNHMGSRFSRYRAGLEIVMAEVKKRGVEFLDSRTTPDSIAEKIAEEYSIPTTHRDVFLDHVEIASFVTTAMREAERIARRKGAAVVIGHPKDITLAALEAWLPSLEAKGFQLVPLTTVIKYRQIQTDTNVARR